MEKKIHYIPAIPRRLENKVAIYCRVSTNDTEQLSSLANQVSALTRERMNYENCSIFRYSWKP